MSKFDDHMGVEPKIGKHPKMDGENNGKPFLKWMIWGETPPFSETSIFLKLFESTNYMDKVS